MSKPMTATYKLFMENLMDCCPTGVLEKDLQLAGFYNPNTIYKYGVEYPSVYRIVELCKAWGCTPNDLLKGLY